MGGQFIVKLVTGSIWRNSQIQLKIQTEEQASWWACFYLGIIINTMPNGCIQCQTMRQDDWKIKWKKRLMPELEHIKRCCEEKDVEWDVTSAQSQCELNAHKRVMCILCMCGKMWSIIECSRTSTNSVDRPQSGHLVFYYCYLPRVVHI